MFCKLGKTSWTSTLAPSDLPCRRSRKRQKYVNGRLSALQSIVTETKTGLL
ncbi:hypothetical protein RBWH47_04569 [Rhodopirellula baltica WH47]|uniref:Uncharacterized protein n=1 Tax=Rhodopirellula baltica WH47 TaxID=991778 RepID=F2ALB1_RHOBT|nr:hypothetical protein RBWH47_04569 [Rhodopirellula baltica WH47]